MTLTSAAERATVLTRMVEMHPREVHVHEGLTTLAARERNLRLTCGALDDAEVTWFLVPGTRDEGSVVGVLEEQRSDVLRSLGRLFEREAGYVSTLVPKPRQRAHPLPGNRRATWRQHGQAQVLQLTWFRAEPTGSVVLSTATSCEVEFWTEQDGRLVAPRANRVARSVAARGPIRRVAAGEFTRLCARPVEGEEDLPTFAEFVYDKPDDIIFPIDVVYTWVDASDPAWAQRRSAVTGESYHAESASAARFLNRNELRYSLRSIHAYAPWVRNIHVVTDAQRPSWLTDQPGVRVVDHREIFRDHAQLPTYNSHAIESQLHHIDGLSDHFLYLNDDMFFGRTVVPQSFFLASGLTKIFMSQSRVPMGPVEEGDTPVDAACKNNRRLLQDRFGRTMSQTFQHTPYALRREILAEIEAAFPEEHARTAASRFRSTQDLSITSSLHHYWALFSGQAVASSLRYSYTQLAVPDLGERLTRLLHRRDSDTFCLNDAFSDESEIAGQLAVLGPFLDAYFPVRSPYEGD
jgi:stealth protein CR2/Stealth-like protein